MEGSWSVLRRWKELGRCVNKITSNDLKIIHKGDGIIAISKPYGLPVHSGPKQGKSVLDLMDELKEIHNLKRTPRLLHRLDKYASGLLVMSYDDDVTRKVAELFEQRKIHKTYLAVTNGVPQFLSGVIVDRICEAIVGKKRMRRMVTAKELQDLNHLISTAPDADVMKAYTAYTVLDSNEETCALVRYMSKTGCKHQIRVHSSSSLACPILGDHKYSSFDAEPQRLPLRMLQLLTIEGARSDPDKKKRHIRPWQRALIPLHLFAESIEIPEIGSDGQPLIIKAKVPEFFYETLMNCRLDMDKRTAALKNSEKKKLKILDRRKSL